MYSSLNKGEYTNIDVQAVLTLVIVIVLGVGRHRLLTNIMVGERPLRHVVPISPQSSFCV